MRTEDEIREHREAFDRRYERALQVHDLDAITICATGAAVLAWVLGETKEPRISDDV